MTIPAGRNGEGEGALGGAAGVLHDPTPARNSELAGGIPEPARIPVTATPVRISEVAGAIRRISQATGTTGEPAGVRTTLPPPARNSEVAGAIERTAAVHRAIPPPAPIGAAGGAVDVTAVVHIAAMPLPGASHVASARVETAAVDLAPIPPPTNSEVARATSDLAQKQQQAKDARAELTRLHRAVVEAEERLVCAHSAQLLAANEQLVVAAMIAQTDAEKSAKELKSVSFSSGLDGLTELPNRAVLLDRFGQAITYARRNDTLMALLFLDLDNFKQINDTHGHAVGDQALKIAAQCLVSAIRAGDTVSRHGGDEFLVLLAGVARASDAVLVAEKVIVALGTPFQIGDHVIRLTASIGISVFPDDADDVHTLIDLADAAMYLAKKHESGKFVFHGLRTGQTCRPPAVNRRGSGSP